MLSKRSLLVFWSMCSTTFSLGGGSKNVDAMARATEITRWVPSLLDNTAMLYPHMLWKDTITPVWT
ncbi:hypothetical protein ATCV1_z615R [Acanthocystis turfacea chlorella virus 1]|uniref:Uncharacterized protein z615R n=1 Tax=Chlorovirus heliozoae TaxID=322019 RepID=A7K9M5_9PHYC|nr:hypothetical protein ATCV1_z615R [Acanthocystis turfacea chlorella virus 1]ABT16749.1 hypothetical protein ATCV1_z615R [Acanthocystis turfacea chlorella virus 1]